MVYTSAATINLTGISYSLVDVYVYVGPGESGKYGNANYNGSVNIGSTTYYYTNINNAADYVLGTDTVGPANVAAGADYVKFSNVSISGGSLKINLQAFNWGNTGIYGFQIVDVSAIPEPSTYALLLTGVLLLAGLRVRDRKRI